MRLTAVTRYAIDGQEFDTTKAAIKHIEERLFKHVQAGTAYAGAGGEQSKMRLELMRYLLDNRKDIAELLAADFTLPEQED